MKKITYSTKKWEKRRETWTKKTAPKAYLQKLLSLLQKDVSGNSFEETIIHYNFISQAASMCIITEYMQTGTFSNAECYLYLASKAHQISVNLVGLNPHCEPQKSGQEIGMDRISMAILADLPLSAIDMLKSIQRTLNEEPNAKRKQRISLEINLYEGLVQGDDEIVRGALQGLNECQYDPLILQVIYAMLEQDATKFLDALILQMRKFRSNPYPETFNYFTLLMEKLYQKRSVFEPLSLADAPSELLKLPPCSLKKIEEVLGISLPKFETEEILEVIDIEKIGLKYMICSV